MTAQPTPARQLARDVLPVGMRRAVMAAARANRPTPVPAAPAELLTALAGQRPHLARTLALHLAYADNAQPVPYSRGLLPAVTTRAELEELRVTVTALLVLAERDLP